MNSSIKKGSNAIYDVAFVVLLVVFLLANHSVLITLWHKWSAINFTGQFGHGPLLIFYAFWHIFKELKCYPQRSSSGVSAIDIRLGITFVIMALGILFLRLISVNFLEQLFVLLSLVLLFWAFYSYDFIRKIKYLLVLLSLALPFWGFLNGFLRFVTLHASNFLLSLTTIPFYKDGYLFHLPNGIFEIADGCSGLQQFLVSMMLGLVYAHQQSYEIRRAVILQINLLVFSVAVNAIRIFIIIIIGFNTQMKSSLVEEHLTLGWVIYGISIFLFFMVYGRFKKDKDIDKRDEENGVDKEHHDYVNLPWSKFGLFAAIIILSWGLYPGYSWALKQQANRGIEENIDTTVFIPSARDGDVWYSPELGSDESLYLKGKLDDKRIDVYVQRYLRLDDAIDPVSKHVLFYNQNNWEIIDSGKVNVQNVQGRNYILELSTIKSKTGISRLLLTWYDVNGNVTSNVIVAKMYMLSGFLRFKHDVKKISMSTEITNDHGHASNLLIKGFSFVSE